jgi:putative heme-binding domain-containing protein
MTSRVNRNSLVHHGSTIKCKEEPDLVAATDPWFRPVDLQLAPDGSLYIADFYNRIIGHYEVPLDHPGRDRHRGRIWRLVYKGDGAQPARPRIDLTSSSIEELIAALGSPNLTQRLLATDQLVDRIGEAAAPALVQAFQSSDNPHVRSHALWGAARLGALSSDSLIEAAKDPDREVRVHAMRVLSEKPEWSEQERALVFALLTDREAFVQSAAADALAQHPHFTHIAPLLELISAAPAEDVLLRHAGRIALRNQLREGENLARLASLSLDDDQSAIVAGVMIAVGSPESAAWLIENLERHPLPADQLRKTVEYAARHIDPQRIDSLAAIARNNFGADLELQQTLLRSIRDGLAQRGSPPPPSLREWGLELATRLLDSVEGKAPQWINTPLPEARNKENPWVVQRRVSADGDTQSRFLCSLPRGEQLTGILRSPEFAVPEKLSFYAAGHIGPPNQPVSARNFIRLKDAATGAVLAEARPPRNDTAQRIEWELPAHRGRRGYIEVVDGDQRGAYAWLAVGRFQPEVVAVPEFDPSQIDQRRQAAAQLAGELQLRDLLPRLVDLLRQANLEVAGQKALADAILALRPDPLLAALMPVVEDAGSSESLRRVVIQAVADPEEQARKDAVAKSFQQSPQRVQAAIAQNLASTREGAETLLAVVEAGPASPRLLTAAVIESRLAAHKINGLPERVHRLTSSLPPANETLRQLIHERRERHPRFQVSLPHGEQVYQKHCAACHQVGGKGALIGPQLDGIGARGLERVLEDVLAPNQNVDVAFRATTFILADGRVLTGLVRREEGEVLVVADNKGEELKLPKSDIDEEAKTNLSLMPENVAEIVPEEDFHHLLGYLLSLRGEPALVENSPGQE